MARALITLVIADSDADTSAVSVFVSVDTGDTVSTLGADYAHVFWDAVRPLVDGILTRVTVALEPDISGWTNNIVDVLSDIQERVTFTLRVCSQNRPVKLTLPTVKEVIFENMGASPIVDFTNTDVIAFSHVLENGVVDGGIGMTDMHGVDICQVMSGEQSWGKR